VDQNPLQGCEGLLWGQGVSPLLQTAPLKKPACLASAYLYNQKQRNPPGEIVRISLDSRTGQKQTEDAGSKEMCQEKRQNPSAENEKILERNSSLVSHHCVYSVKRLYKCSDCTKSFKWKSHLTCHQRIHSEERPFKSPDCPKSFKTNSHLMGHQRIHKGERPINKVWWEGFCDMCAVCTGWLSRTDRQGKRDSMVLLLVMVG
uniref:C2H2-type domain-containing protein n=1 Tax=Coturnix japonica TaxID=93934 RepID=A0A8C2TX14_COTJA